MNIHWTVKEILQLIVGDNKVIPSLLVSNLIYWVIENDFIFKDSINDRFISFNIRGLLRIINLSLEAVMVRVFIFTF